jgi:hypothetical protein
MSLWLSLFIFFVFSFQGRRYLIVVCEAKVIVLDLQSSGCKELTKAQLDGKSPCDVSMLYMGGPRYRVHGQNERQMMPLPLMAVGLSDGSIRLVALATMQVRLYHVTACVKHVIVRVVVQGYVNVDECM